MKNQIDINEVNIRLENIKKKATSSISFTSSESTLFFQESYSSSILTCLENIEEFYRLNPRNIEPLKDWNILAYDESINFFKALEGDLAFYCTACISLEKEYAYNLRIKPFFITSMKKFYGTSDEEGIVFSTNPGETRKMQLLDEKISIILDSANEGSIIFIDGPLIAGNIASYLIGMDEELRERNCIPVYFIKNSDSRMILDNMPYLTRNYNSDFHWAHDNIPLGRRSSFFKYVDQDNPRQTKTFAYIKPVYGFPQRVEMHSKTFEKYRELIPGLFDLIAYYFVAQKTSNPQVRPIAVAEQYAREGLKVLNIPALLRRIGFQPTLNQVRFR